MIVVVLHKTHMSVVQTVATARGLLGIKCAASGDMRHLGGQMLSTGRLTLVEQGIS